MGSLRTVLVAALVLDLGVLAFVVSTGRSLSGAFGMAALAVGVSLAVGSGIVFLQRRSGDEMERLALQTNAALRVIAQRAGLQYVEALPSRRTANPQDRFAEVRGASDGVQVCIALQSITSDDLYTTIFFPRRALPAPAMKEVRPLVEEFVAGEDGITLYLGRTPSWFSSIGWNPIPETDVDRVLLILDRTRQLLRGSASAAGPTPEHHR